jgi:glycerol kinase
MARNAWFLQCQTDILGIPVLQSTNSEATALGAAFLAGLRLGVWPGVDSLRSLALQGRRFEPRWTAEKRRQRRREWHRAVRAVIGLYSEAESEGK